MGRAALLVEVVLSFAYPVLVHVLLRLGWHQGAAATLLGLALVLAGSSLLSLRRAKRLAAWRGVGVALVLAALAVLSWFEHQWALLSYPLAVSLGLFLTFFSSLFRERSLIETLARLTDPELDGAKILHCRRATQAWSVFFLANACVAGLSSWLAPLWVWTLYTGLVSYLLAATLGLVELLVRVRRFGGGTAGPLGRWVLGALRGLGGSNRWSRFLLSYAILVATLSVVAGSAAALHAGFGLTKFGGLEYVPRVTTLSSVRVIGPSVSASATLLALLLWAYPFRADASRPILLRTALLRTTPWVFLVSVVGVPLGTALAATSAFVTAHWVYGVPWEALMHSVEVLTVSDWVVTLATFASEAALVGAFSALAIPLLASR